MWDPGLFRKWSIKPPPPMSGGFRPGFAVWALFVESASSGFWPHQQTNSPKYLVNITLFS